jgi:translation initiation factor 3 subunit E
VTKPPIIMATAEYDLTQKMSKFLDTHLMLPLLEFLSQNQIFEANQIEQAKLQLIEKTSMVDYAVDIFQSLNQTDEVCIHAKCQ